MTTFEIGDKISLAPGIYPNMPMAEYRRVEGMNQSTLSWCRISPLHLKAAIDGRLAREDTDALSFGRALHIRLLEPDRYAESVKAKGLCEAELQGGKRKGEKCGAPGRGIVNGVWCCGTHGGDDSTLPPNIEYLNQHELRDIESAAKAVAAHKVESLRRAKGLFEVVVVGELNGVKVKARLDKLIENPCTIVDVKKVAAATSPSRGNISADDFQGRIGSMGYGMQAAMYCDLVKSITGKLPRWYWLMIEDGEPFSPAIVRASENCLAAGRNEYMSYLNAYKSGLATGHWPGPADDVVELDGPNWWLKQMGVQV